MDGPRPPDQSDTGMRPLDAIHPDSAPDSIARLVTDLHKDSCAVNAKKFTAAQEELAFALRFQHYRQDRGRTNDQRQVQPHAPELFDLQRQKAGEILSDPQFLECRPQNEGDDNPGVADDTKVALESVLYNPLMGFSRAKRKAVIGMLAARSWLIGVDVVEGIGKYGKEVVFKAIPRWKVHIAPGWDSMHDITCPWVGEEADMRIGDIRRMASKGWINTEKVRPDGHAGGAAVTVSSSQGVPLGASNTVNLHAVDQSLSAPSETETALVLKWLFRYDDETIEGEPGPVRTLPRDMHMQVCPMCGHSTEPSLAQPPPEQVETCPACKLSPMLDTTEVQEVALFEKYPDGRLVIVAPGTMDDDGQPLKLFDGPWPYKLRSFPYAHYRCYEDPIEAEGQSDTSVHWWSVLILNGLRRFGWEQMRRNVDLIIALKGQLEDAQGRPWTFNDLHGQVAYGKSPEAMSAVKHFQGGGISPGLIQFHEMMLAPFRGSLGTEDLALTPEQSRDIPVGTVRQLARSGNIPIRQHRELIDEEDSILYGVVVDMLCQCWGPERARAVLGENGEYRLKAIKQTALSSLQVIVSASPKLSAIRADEIAGFKEWTATMAEDPAAGIAIAKLANIPMGLVRDYLQNKAKQAETLPPATPGGAPPPARPGMNGGNPPIANGVSAGAQ